MFKATIKDDVCRSVCWGGVLSFPTPAHTALLRRLCLFQSSNGTKLCISDDSECTWRRGAVAGLA